MKDQPAISNQFLVPYFYSFQFVRKASCLKLCHRSFAEPCDEGGHPDECQTRGRHLGDEVPFSRKSFLYSPAFDLLLTWISYFYNLDPHDRGI